MYQFSLILLAPYWWECKYSLLRSAFYLTCASFALNITIWIFLLYTLNSQTPFLSSKSPNTSCFYSLITYYRYKILQYSKHLNTRIAQNIPHFTKSSKFKFQKYQRKAIEFFLSANFNYFYKWINIY